MKTILTALFFGALTLSIHANPIGKEVEYPSADRTHRSFLAHPAETDGKRPAVLILPEWWGLNLHARTVARELAELGYVALAVDMYGEGKTAANPVEATALVTEVLTTPGAITARFRSARAFLESQPGVDPERIVVLGYCFGGRVALENARQGIKAAGIYTLHGILDTEQPAKLGEIKTPIHVFNGAADPMVNNEAVLKFTGEMLEALATFTITSYPGVKHSFTNPDATAKGEAFDMPLAFDPHAAQDSWRVIIAFLNNLK